MINEETGKEPVCQVCQHSEWWECGHLVASVDSTFAECHGGELYDHDDLFRDTIRMSFSGYVGSGSIRAWSCPELQELWKAACEEASPADDIYIDGWLFYPFVLDLLEQSGAIRHPGSLVTQGGPGMSSSEALLFGSEPRKIVDAAHLRLRSLLAVEGRELPELTRGSANPYDERLESILALIAKDGRVCPRPQQWDKLWKLLPDRSKDNGVWQPAPPLILSAWRATSDEQKATRLREHIRWAADRGALDAVAEFLINLAEDEWHHSGNV